MGHYDTTLWVLVRCTSRCTAELILRQVIAFFFCMEILFLRFFAISKLIIWFLHGHTGA